MIAVTIWMGLIGGAVGLMIARNFEHGRKIKALTTLIMAQHSLTILQGDMIRRIAGYECPDCNGGDVHSEDCAVTRAKGRIDDLMKEVGK